MPSTRRNPSLRRSSPRPRLDLAMPQRDREQQHAPTHFDRIIVASLAPMPPQRLQQLGVRHGLQQFANRGERWTIFEAIPGEERLGDVDLPAGSSVNGCRIGSMSEVRKGSPSVHRLGGKSKKREALERQRSITDSHVGKRPQPLPTKSSAPRSCRHRNRLPGASRSWNFPSEVSTMPVRTPVRRARAA
jgi:hypothetical protein